MDRFHEMAVFVAVAEEEGFAAAARRLNMSPPAVTRAIAALETRMGVKLLNRTTRFVRATTAGLRFLEDARRILSDVNAAEEAAAGINAAPSGQVSVTAPQMFGRLFVLPGILAYLERYADTRVQAVFLDRVVNLLEEGFDVSVRIGELEDSSMRAVRVGSVRNVLCASPQYLHDHGEPRDLQALSACAAVAVTPAGSVNWRFVEDGRARLLKLRPRLCVTTNEAALAAASAGFGITRLLSYQVAEQVARGELKIILQQLEPPASPIHILHREGRLQTTKIRAFVDLMAAQLKGDARLNPA